jgi:hypothetical protein
LLLGCRWDVVVGASSSASVPITIAIACCWWGQYGLRVHGSNNGIAKQKQTTKQWENGHVIKPRHFYPFIWTDPKIFKKYFSLIWNFFTKFDNFFRLFWTKMFVLKSNFKFVIIRKFFNKGRKFISNLDCGQKYFYQI